MSHSRGTALASLLLILVMLLPTGSAGGSPVPQEWHPGPRASCPICAMRLAQAIATQVGSTSRMSTTAVRNWMRTNASRVGADVEVDPRLVRAKLLEYENYSYLDEVNAAGRGKYVVAQVESSPKGDGTSMYAVYTGGKKPVYVGDDVRELVTAVNNAGGRQNLSAIYFVPKDLPAARRDAFLSSAKIQQRQINSGVSVEVVGARGSAARAYETFFSPGARLVEESVTEAAAVPRGRFRGFFTSSLKFARSGKEATLDFFARRRERLNSFVENVTARMKRDPGRSSMASLLSSARADFNRTYGLRGGELYVRYRDEFGRTQWVEIPGDENAAGVAAE